MVEPNLRLQSRGLFDLRPPRDLGCYRATARAAKPYRDDLVGLLHAGQPHTVALLDFAVVIGMNLVIGANPLAAAVRELGLASDAIRGGRRETTGVRS